MLKIVQIIMDKEMDNKFISNSIVAGGNVKKSINVGDDNEIFNHSTVIREAKKQAFWVSLITGILSSLAASFIFSIICN